MKSKYGPLVEPILGLIKMTYSEVFWGKNLCIPRSFAHSSQHLEQCLAQSERPVTFTEWMESVLEWIGYLQVLLLSTLFHDMSFTL